ncbi:hypothetical protein DL89DRAFT_16852 [Linderina pennispora]|uniref:Uncharacterized protein n=1 Tax=Linderina pennispora TaxID=61395 RepID=A0A1Y1WLM9_9FUNG|nr:uncharacterized protein DL89DRAFT_16852 [Linderina pennispora]ORX74467.1 hypothetical protein DL89DRAFT_16852 [Linderina pennispora]
MPMYEFTPHPQPGLAVDETQPTADRVSVICLHDPQGIELHLKQVLALGIHIRICFPNCAVGPIRGNQCLLFNCSVCGSSADCASGTRLQAGRKQSIAWLGAQIGHSRYFPAAARTIVACVARIRRAKTATRNISSMSDAMTILALHVSHTLIHPAAQAPTDTGINTATPVTSDILEKTRAIVNFCSNACHFADMVLVACGI